MNPKFVSAALCNRVLLLSLVLVYFMFEKILTIWKEDCDSSVINTLLEENIQ
jgi:hypothetical protein